MVIGLGPFSGSLPRAPARGYVRPPLRGSKTRPRVFAPDGAFVSSPRREPRGGYAYAVFAFGESPAIVMASL